MYSGTCISNTNQAVQPQKMAKALKFLIKEKRVCARYVEKAIAPSAARPSCSQMRN